MSAPGDVRELVAEIRATCSTLDRVHGDLQLALIPAGLAIEL